MDLGEVIREIDVPEQAPVELPEPAEEPVPA